MTAWPGWENFEPGAPGQTPMPGERPAPRHKYRAEQTLVTDDGTMFSRANLETLAGHQGVAVRDRRGRTRPLLTLAQDLALRGIGFPSKREATRWLELRDRERAGLITELRRQVRYPLHVNGVEVAAWVADFTYIEAGVLVVEDSKGYRTAVYRQKRAHFQQEYGAQIRET